MDKNLYELKVVTANSTEFYQHDNLQTAKRHGHKLLKEIERLFGIGADVYIDVYECKHNVDMDIEGLDFKGQYKLFLYNSGRHYWRRNK